MPSPFSSSRLFSAAPILFVALLWLLPFSLPDHKVPFGTFWQEWIAAGLLLSAIFFVLLQSSSALTLNLPQIVIAPLGLTVVLALQCATGLLSMSAQVFIPMLYLLLAVFACVLGSTMMQNGSLEKACTWIALVCLAGGIFNVTVQIAQLLKVETTFPFMSPLLPGQRPFGNINQSNHIAAYLGMSLASVFYLRIQSRLSLISTWITAVALITGLVLTGQRSAITYVCMPLVVVLLSWKIFVPQRKGLLWVSVALPILFVLMNMIVQSLSAGTASPLEMMASKSFYSNRWVFWQHAWHMFQTHPLLGVGFDQFWAAFFDQIEQMPAVDEAPNHPHNLIAALLAETGILGTLAVCVPVLIWLWRTRLAAASSLQWLALIQILIISFHSLIEYPLWYSYFLILLAFWLGATSVSGSAITLSHPRPYALAFAFLSLFVLSDLGSTYSKFRAAVWKVPHARIADIATFTPPKPKALDGLTNHWFFQRAVLFWLPDLRAIEPQTAAENIALNQQAINVAPSSATLYRQILLLVLSGRSDEAVHLMHRARLIFPDRYREMRLALIAATKKWPQQFVPVLDRLVNDPIKSNVP